jgi:nucleoside-diphosphate-sugar epimerase
LAERTEQIVGVLGADSAVGKILLPMLRQSGWRVAAFSRREQTQTADGVAWHRLPQSPGAAHALPEAVSGWISLAPLRVLPDYFPLLEACGAQRVVAFSSTSRFTKERSSDLAEQALARDLAHGEEQLARWAATHGVEWVVLRPTLIYGFGLDRNVREIAWFSRRFGFFPVLGSAHGLRQPVHVSDVAAACLAALQRPEAANRAYNISGGETLEYREMVTRVFQALGRQPRFLTIPLWMFRLAVKLLKIVPRFRGWSSAMAERMNQDMAFDHAEAAQDLGFAPRPFLPTKEDVGK